MSGRSVWGWFALVAALAAVAFAGLTVYDGSDGIADALRAFDWRLAPVLLGLSCADYALRFLRWRLLFRRATGRTLPLTADAAIFLAGTAMIVTPGRMGEWVKSYYAARFFDVPASETAPIPVVERLADALAMSLLAAAGAAVLGGAIAPAVGGAALATMGLFALRSRRAGAAAVSALRQVPGGGRLARPFEAFIDGSNRLCAPRPFALAFAIGLTSWGVECAAFYLVLSGLGLGGGWEALAEASFIYPLATLAGTFSLLPGGLGVTEGGIAALVQRLAGATLGTAAAAALIIRVAIVGFGVVIGLAPLAYLTWRAGSPEVLDRTSAGAVIGRRAEGWKPSASG